MIIIFFSLVALLVYVFIVQWYRYAWNRYPRFIPAEHGVKVPVSVVVAFRNEGKNMETLILSLKNQVYPAEHFEVILVNDHSEDGSEIIAKEMTSTIPNFRVISNPTLPGGKKSALEAGIQSALNELIITTDADCTFQSEWIETLAGFYRDEQPDMIIGPVDITCEPVFFGKYQEVEFLSLIASGVGAAAAGRPIYCNAACFAFRKSLFVQMHDPLNRKVISGDDTFFLHAVKRIQARKIRLVKSYKAVATTRGFFSVKDYLDQHRRWVSKSIHYRDRDVILTAVAVLLVNFCVIVSAVLLVVGLNCWLFPLLFFGKAISDYLMVRDYMRFCCKRTSLVEFLVFSFMYPFVTLWISISGLFMGYQWKGRYNTPSIG
jgi:glycosyltransferase involved in cell wall biosynthesis